MEKLKLEEKQLARKTSDSESEAEGGGEYQKYSLENLDNKILEMKQNKAGGPTQPGRSNILQHVRNPQDVVQSHYLQVQSMFQETLAAGQHQHHQHQQQNNKNDCAICLDNLCIIRI